MSGWNWNTQNGDGNATQAEIIAAYNALTGRGRIADFHATVWQDIIAAIKELRQDFGDSDWPTNFTHNEQSGSIITALSFMDSAYAIPLGKDKHWSWIDRVNRPELKKGDSVYGQYFLDLAAEIERKANMTLLHPTFDTVVDTDADTVVRLLQLLAVRGLFGVNVTPETTIHLYDLLPTKLTDRADISINAVVKKLLMLPTKAVLPVTSHADTAVELWNALNVNLGELQQGYAHRVHVPLIRLLEAILPPQDRFLDIEANMKLILRATIGWTLGIGVQMTDNVRLMRLLQVNPIAASHSVNVVASVAQKEILTLVGALTAQTGSTVNIHERVSIPVKYGDTYKHTISAGIHRLGTEKLYWSDFFNTSIYADLASIYAKSIGFNDNYHVDVEGYAWLQEPLTVELQSAMYASLMAFTQLLGCVPLSYTLSAQTMAEGLAHILSAIPFSICVPVGSEAIANAHFLESLKVKFEDAASAMLTAKAHRNRALPFALNDSTAVNVRAASVAKNIVFISGSILTTLSDYYNAHVLGIERVLFLADSSADMSAKINSPQSIKVKADLAVAGTETDAQITLLNPVTIDVTAQSDTQIDADVQCINATRVGAADEINAQMSCSVSMSGLTLLSELSSLTLYDLDAYSLRAMTHNNFLLIN